MPFDPPLPHHQYGPKMVALCLNMASRIGLRATPDCMKMVFEHMGIVDPTPE
jgi:hypothetical protein